MKMNRLLVPLALLTPGVAFCWDYTGNYDNTPPEYELNIQTPAIIDTVKIGGFQLQVDRVEAGYYVPQNPHGDFLGQLRGHAFNVTVTRLPRTSAPLEAVAAKTAVAKGDTVKIANVHGSGGLQGVRVESCGKANFFSSNIHSIRYLFRNPEGEIICFDAQATRPNPDWDIVRHMIAGTIEPARA